MREELVGLIFNHTSTLDDNMLECGKTITGRLVYKWERSDHNEYVGPKP